MREMTVEEDRKIDKLARRLLNNQFNIQGWVDCARHEYDIDHDDILPLIRSVICLRTDFRSMMESDRKVDYSLWFKTMTDDMTEIEEDAWLDDELDNISDDILEHLGTEDRLVYRAYFDVKAGTKPTTDNEIGATLFYQRLKLNESFIFGDTEYSETEIGTRLYYAMKYNNEWIETGPKRDPDDDPVGQGWGPKTVGLNNDELRRLRLEFLRDPWPIEPYLMEGRHPDYHAIRAEM